MADDLIDVSPEWAKKAYVDDAKSAVLEEHFEALLDNWEAPTAQPFDLGLVNVDTGNRMSHTGQTRASGKPHVASPDHCNRCHSWARLAATRVCSMPRR